MLKTLEQMNEEVWKEDMIVYRKQSLDPGNKKTHGMSHTRFYAIYHGAYARCNNPNAENYSNYGLKGVEFLWGNFEKFKEDMLQGYIELSLSIGESNVSIERLDNSKGYSKENCIRVHLSKQQSHRETNRYLTYKGETLSALEWSRELGINYGTLLSRIKDSGRSTEMALSTPIGNAFGNKTPIVIVYKGCDYLVKDFEKICGYSRKTIYRKIKKGELETR